MQGSREISGFLLFLSRGENSCQLLCEGEVMCVGESVLPQDQKIDLSKTTYVKNKHFAGKLI